MAKRAFVTRFCRHSTRYPNAGEWGSSSTKVSEGNTGETASLLSMAKKRGYWRLKVDYHVGAAGRASISDQAPTSQPTEPYLEAKRTRGK